MPFPPPQFHTGDSNFVRCSYPGWYRIGRTKAPRVRTSRRKKTLPNVPSPFRGGATRVPSIPDTMFIMDIGDMPSPSLDTPLFQFQKPRGSHSILLPDIDFIGLDYYHHSAVADRLLYQEKATSAIFVGGTSGQTNTVETIRTPVSPRLRVAKHFRGRPDIRVLLTTLSRCEMQKPNKHSVTWALAALPYGVE